MTGVKSPRVSVVMPVYNGEKYLREAIESILNQTFTDFEFIIIDDGSTDSTGEILSSYDDKRIQLVKIPDNLGISRSLNVGIELSKGEYLARMDADDISLSNRFARQVAFLEQHEDIGVLGSAYQRMNAAGEAAPQVSQRNTEWQLVHWFLHFDSPIAHPTAMIRTDLLKRVNGYNPELRYAQDYDLWCRLSAITHLANLSESFLFYRHGYAGQISTSWSEQQTEIAVQIRQQFVQQLTGKIYSQEAIYSLTYPALIKTASVSWEAVRVVEDVYDCFIIKIAPITLDQLLTIRLDATGRIRHIMRPLPLTPRKIYNTMGSYLKNQQVKTLFRLQRLRRKLFSS